MTKICVYANFAYMSKSIFYFAFTWLLRRKNGRAITLGFLEVLGLTHDHFGVVAIANDKLNVYTWGGGGGAGLSLRMPWRIYHQDDCLESRCNNNRGALLHLELSLWDSNTKSFLYRGNCCSSSVSMNL